MVTITKSTVTSSVFENFYDRLKNNVTTVTLSDSSVVTIQRYASAFPDSNLDEKSDYPVMVVNTPNFNWEDVTLTKKAASGRIVIDIYTTKAEAADKFADAIIESIETYRDDYRILGLRNINLDSTLKTEAFRGSIKVHIKSVTFTFKYTFDKTLAW